MKLIVGLGNPGKRYQGTRHNVGFLVIDRLAQQKHIEFSKRVCDALIGEWFRGGETMVLARPQSFMNRSGEAVTGLLAEYRGTADDLVVVYDDLDLPFGRIRIRPQGSAGGHRGMRSIQEHLGGAPFCRIRVGIGRPAEGVDPADYVLEPFSVTEQEGLGEYLDRAAASLDCLLAEGVERAMGQFNRVP
ncbi:MAG: aminoacyl-tRNA hydrolase [Candidatus Binatia bacterium]